MELHFAHEINYVSKTLKTKATQEKTLLPPLFLSRRQQCELLVSWVSEYTPSLTSKLVLDLRTIRLVGRLTQLFVVEVLEEVFVDRGADE